MQTDHGRVINKNRHRLSTYSQETLSLQLSGLRKTCDVSVSSDSPGSCTIASIKVPPLLPGQGLINQRDSSLNFGFHFQFGIH